jgi:hypothetical protein
MNKEIKVNSKWLNKKFYDGEGLLQVTNVHNYWIDVVRIESIKYPNLNGKTESMPIDTLLTHYDEIE